MNIPGRLQASTRGYRFGFNGKEQDNEVKGEANQQDHGARVYDSRIGRFLSLDPEQMQYPELTPFQFASNTPIQAVDLDGRECLVVTSGSTHSFWGSDYDGILKNATPQQREDDPWGAFGLDLTNDLANLMGIGMIDNLIATLSSPKVTNTEKVVYFVQTGLGSAGLKGKANQANAPKPKPNVGKAAFSAFEFYMEKAKTLDVSTKRDNAVVYSGPGNRAKAEKYANKNQKTTLEMTKGGKWLDNQKLFGPDSPLTSEQAVQVFKVISKRFAEGASGNVSAFTKGGKGKAIFRAKELPALDKNAKVTSVT
jgi:RHS repeat-associated protein